MPKNEIPVRFPGAQGHTLVGRLHRPPGPIRACALFAHCFTCSKDLRAARHLAATLAGHGFATLRFDFTGLGQSEGEFAETTFASNVGDLVAAANWMRQEHEAPRILVGHSLGGTAVLMAAGEIPEVEAIATIGAPAEPVHVEALFGPAKADIEAAGEAEVLLAGRPFRIKKAFLDDLRAHPVPERVRQLKKALLVFHSPQDDTVGVENARAIYDAARHPKSFVSLDGADHLLGMRADAQYVADMLAAWAGRYVSPPAEREHEERPVVVEGRDGFQQHIAMGPHALLADEPASVGGLDTGPSPYDLLLAALGACTSMTLRMYADRKKWPLESVRVGLQHAKIHAQDCADCESEKGRIDEIQLDLDIRGDLSEEQRARLTEIAHKCPVHRTLVHNEVKVRVSPA